MPDSTNSSAGAAPGVQLQGDATRAYAIRRIQRMQAAQQRQVPGRVTQPPKPRMVKETGY